MDLQTTMKKRWLYLAVGVVGMLFVGILYGWSILKVPFAESFGWSESSLAAAYTISIGFYCFGNICCGYICKKLPTKTTLIAAGALILIGFLWTSRQTGSILSMYLSYGVCVGFGIGIVYGICISAASAWFPDRTGLASGTMMMGFGISVMLLGNIISGLFDSIGWRMTYTILAFVIFTVVFVCALILRLPTPQDVLPSPQKKTAKADDDMGQNNFSFSEVVRRPSYWIFFVYGTAGASVGSAMISLARDVALSLGAAAALATTLVGILSVFNGLGRVVWGVLFDALGRRKAMIASSILTLLAPSLLLIASLTGSLPLGIVGLCLTGLSFASYPTISAVFIASAYGPKDFSMNYGVSNCKILVSSFSAVACSALISSTGTYASAFILLIGLAVVSFVLNLFLKKP